MKAVFGRTVFVAPAARPQRQNGVTHAIERVSILMGWSNPAGWLKGEKQLPETKKTKYTVRYHRTIWRIDTRIWKLALALLLAVGGFRGYQGLTDLKANVNSTISY
jgi:hypothetical protein